MMLALIAALALQATTPAPQGGSSAPVTPTPAPTPAVAAAPAKPVPEKKICEYQTVVGSSIETKVCKTKAQWDAAAEKARNAAGMQNDLRTDLQR